MRKIKNKKEKIRNIGKIKAAAVILAVILFAFILNSALHTPNSALVSAEAATNGYAYKYMEKFFEDGKNRQRRTDDDAAEKTVDWIAAEFEALGLESSVVKKNETDKDFRKPFDITSAGTIFTQGATKTAYNVAGLFKAGGSLNTVVIGANYDNLYGLQYSQGFTSKSEGVLDNASGICSMLAVAQAVVENAKPENGGILPGFNIIFVAFGANNDGLLGSADFVNDMSAYKGSLPGLDFSKISLMVNLSRVAGGDKLYLYCDEVETLHQNLIKRVADGQNNFYGLNLPPQNKKIVLDGSSPLGYTHKGLQGDHYYFWAGGVNTACFFGYNWDVNGTGDTESETGTVAGTVNDAWDKLFTIYKDGAKMMDSAVNIVTGVIYDGEAPAAFAGSRSQKYDYRSFWANSLYPFIFRLAAIAALCIVFALLYVSGRKNTPKTIMRKYAAKVAVFGDDYENPPEPPQNPSGQPPQDQPEPRNPFPPNGF